MNLICEYIKYIVSSKKRHGIHSPFVYNFTDKCLKSKINNAQKEFFNLLRADFQYSKEHIIIHDFGAGSKKKGVDRSISSIYKNAAVSKKYGSLLYNISNHYKPKNTLELGTNLGVGTFYLAKGSPAATKIITVEGDKTLHSIAERSILKYKQKNIECVHQTFEQFLSTNKLVFDIVYIDGDHRSSSLKNYLYLLDSVTHDETLFILDDIRWSQDMFDYWQLLTTDSKYHLTIDLFRMGILLKKKTKEKEHFTIRY